MSIFEKASRMKLRFNTDKGNITVEDLWGLPLTTQSTNRLCLDVVYQGLNRQVRETVEESLVKTSSSINTELKLKLDIVKHIAEVKMAEAEQKEKAAERKATRERIKDILAEKQEEGLKSKSEAELQELLKSLE